LSEFSAWEIHFKSWIRVEVFFLLKGTPLT